VGDLPLFSWFLDCVTVRCCLPYKIFTRELSKELVAIIVGVFVTKMLRTSVSGVYASENSRSDHVNKPRIVCLLIHI